MARFYGNSEIRLPVESAMLKGEDAPARWFLISDADSSALRIVSNLHVGESTEGALTFNDDDSTCRWLAFRVEADGVWLEAIEQRARLTTEAGGWLERQPLLPGLVLAFPRNRVTINQDILAHPAPGPVITVEPLPSEHTDVGFGELVTIPKIYASDTRPETDNATEAPSKPSVRRFRLALMLALLSVVVLAALPSVLTEVKLDLTPIREAVARMTGQTQPPTTPALETSAPAELIDSTKTAKAKHAQLDEPIAPRVETQVARDLVSSRDVTSTLASDAQPDRTPASDVATPSLVVELNSLSWTQGLQPNESTPRPESSDTFEAQVQAGAEPKDLASEGVASRVQSRLPSPGDPISDASDDSRISKARQLMEAGQITYPPGNNAVALLIAVVADNPSHPEALSLLGECSDNLIRRARQLYAAGRNYEARNALEEVLVFNPENERANRLWRDWVESKP